MADQRPWIKLWKSFRTDPGIQRLTYRDQGRWLHLLLFVAEHGVEGVWTGPLRSLVHALDFAAEGARARRLCGRFLGRVPGVTVTAADTHEGQAKVRLESGQGQARVSHESQGEQLDFDTDPLTVTVTFRNWSKYQESNSLHRTRAWRGKRHGDAPTPSPDPSHTPSQASPNVTRSRSRRDKNPLTPVAGSPKPASGSAHTPPPLPTYPEPPPGTYENGLASVRAILDGIGLPPKPVPAWGTPPTPPPDDDPPEVP